MRKRLGAGVRLSLLGVAMLTMACAGGISNQARSQVNNFVPFADVQQSPDQYQGDTVIWGGKVIETQVKGDATEITVLQLELGNQDSPQDNDQSKGRFLIRSALFLDPALYPQGTLLTVVGRLQGSEKRLIGEMPYDYPVIEPTEIKKWPSGPGTAPRFRFGFGIGTHF